MEKNGQNKMQKPMIQKVSLAILGKGQLIGENDVIAESNSTVKVQCVSEKGLVY